MDTSDALTFAPKPSRYRVIGRIKSHIKKGLRRYWKRGDRAKGKRSIVEQTAEMFDLLHDEAMALADEGAWLERRFEPEEAMRAFSKAFDLEQKAQTCLPTKEALGHAVIYQSLVYLAVQAGRFEDAKAVLAAALEKDLPAAIRADLAAMRVRLKALTAWDHWTDEDLAHELSAWR